jgi:hypothetical protein
MFHTTQVLSHVRGYDNDAHLSSQDPDQCTRHRENLITVVQRVASGF